MFLNLNKRLYFYTSIFGTSVSISVSIYECKLLEILDCFEYTTFSRLPLNIKLASIYNRMKVQMYSNVNEIIC